MGRWRLHSGHCSTVSNASRWGDYGCFRRLQPPLGARGGAASTAGFGAQRTWSTRFDMRSPRYTTRIDDIPVVGSA
ncbi:DUF4113 domain-containing protein [Methylobacterium bullatum]|uniref:DUF4113 domain-containing protein n=1 Tax=Methylobacterium bullatum TaxID=570505 RepID=UPI003570B04F